MHRLIDLLAAPDSMLRRYLLACLALASLTFLGAQALSALTRAGAPEQPLPAAQPGGGTRLYTVTRSVLDDPATTASIPRPAATRVDPCRE